MSRIDFKSLVNAFEGERMIKIVAGQGAETATFNVLFHKLAPLGEDFSNAIKEDVVVQPDDTPAAWRVLIYYLITNQIPTPNSGLVDAGGSTQIESWLLGARYHLPEFQDGIMKDLLRSLDSKVVDIKPDTLSSFWNSCESFDKFMVDEMLRKVFVDKTLLRDDASFTRLNQTPHFFNLMTKTVENMVQRRGTLPARINDQSQMWREYMVGNGKGKSSPVKREDDNGSPAERMSDLPPWWTPGAPVHMWQSASGRDPILNYDGVGISHMRHDATSTRANSSPLNSGGESLQAQFDPEYWKAGYGTERAVRFV